MMKSSYLRITKYKVQSTKCDKLAVAKYMQRTTTIRSGHTLAQDALLRLLLTPFEPLAVIRCYNFKSTTLSTRKNVAAHADRTCGGPRYIISGIKQHKRQTCNIQPLMEILPLNFFGLLVETRRHTDHGQSQPRLREIWAIFFRFVLPTTLTVKSTKLKIGTPTSRNVRTNFDFSTPFCFRVNSQYYSADRRTDRSDGQEA